MLKSAKRQRPTSSGLQQGLNKLALHTVASRAKGQRNASSCTCSNCHSSPPTCSLIDQRKLSSRTPISSTLTTASHLGTIRMNCRFFPLPFKLLQVPTQQRMACRGGVLDSLQEEGGLGHHLPGVCPCCSNGLMREGSSSKASWVREGKSFIRENGPQKGSFF